MQECVLRLITRNELAPQKMSLMSNIMTQMNGTITLSLFLFVACVNYLRLSSSHSFLVVSHKWKNLFMGFDSSIVYFLFIFQPLFSTSSPCKLISQNLKPKQEDRTLIFMHFFLK